jgi:transcriptional regulator with XRE-family HTH domain
MSERLSMSERISPTLRRWELGRALRTIREERGLTIEQVSRDLSEQFTAGFSSSKISRLETGRRGVSPRDVRDLCTYYGVDAAETARLMDLAKGSRLENRLAGAREGYEEYVALETMAHTLRNYETTFVPGLLQTADYTREIINDYAKAGLDPDSSDGTSVKLLQIREERKARLYGPKPIFLDSIVDENVLRRCVGSRQIMRAQLEHMITLSSRKNVRLRVVPAARGNYPGCESSGFALLEFDPDESRSDEIASGKAIYIEGLIGPVWAERSADRVRVSRTFEYLTVICLDDDASREFIRSELLSFT